MRVTQMRITLAALGLFAATATAQETMILEFYELDHLGNVLVVTDADGNVVEEHDYDPYGQELCGTPPNMVPCATMPAGQARRFTGKERDKETGLDYFGARYYEANLGRFTSVDPMMDKDAAQRNPQLWNRYAYGNNNPLKYVDPDGNVAVPALPLVTTLGPPSRAGARLDTAIGMAQGVLMTVVPGLEIRPSSQEQANGQVMGQVLTVVGVVGAWRAGAGKPQVTRYMTEGEVSEALRTGNIPNYGRDGLPRPTHVTTDAPVGSAAEAAARYEIAPPTHRATVPRDRVTGLGRAPDGRATTSGGGSQAATDAPIPVRRSEIKPLD